MKNTIFNKNKKNWKNSTEMLAASANFVLQRSIRLLVAVVILVSMSFAASFFAFAQSSAPTSVSEEMTAARFLQDIKEITALGDLTRSDEIARILGSELEITPQGSSNYRNFVRQPSWINAFHYSISEPGNAIRRFIVFGINIRNLCVTIEDVLAAFDGEYFERPGFLPQIADPELAADFRRHFATGRAVHTIIVPILQPENGVQMFEFMYLRCLMSASIHLPSSISGFTRDASRRVVR